MVAKCLFVMLSSLLPLLLDAADRKIAIVGSGNWGSAAARRIALNILDHSESDAYENYNSTVTMWVYEEQVDGRNLTEIINTDHVNQKYLPNTVLPDNVFACSDILETCCNADVLFFVVPHQFLSGVLRQLKGRVKSTAIGVSLIKGLDVGPNGPELLSQMIQTELALSSEVAVVMGANVASEVAMDQFVEATVACRDSSVARVVSDLLECPCFRTSYSSDVTTVELCGALKNVVAMGAGFCDALGLGSSTKAAVIRRGLKETMDYCRLVAGKEFKIETVLESCGLADCVASSYGGRNRKCAASYATWLLQDQHHSVSNGQATGLLDGEGGGKVRKQGDYMVVQSDELLEQSIRATLESMKPHDDESVKLDYFRQNFSRNDGVVNAERIALLKRVWKATEKVLLDGQKMQGLITCEELMACMKAAKLDEELMSGELSERFSDYALRSTQSTHGIQTSNLTHVPSPKNYERKFGLFRRIHAISHYGDSPTTLFDW